MRKRKVVLAILIPVFVVLVLFAVRFYDDAQNQAGFEAKQAAIDSIINAAFRAPEDVREDLIKRGLITEEMDDSGKIDGGGVWFGRIGELIEDGLYHIDEERALQFGPSQHWGTEAKMRKGLQVAASLPCVSLLTEKCE